MVDDQPVLEFRSLWFPTPHPAQRLMQMNVEYTLNQPRPDGKPSLAKVYWSTGDVDQVLDLLPPYLPAEPRQNFRRLLRPWPEGRYTAAYTRTGGILNLFTPPWGKPQDEIWTAMLAAWEAEAFPDDPARQEALRALEHEWNTAPHPFFANLTPAQVMVGGGPREAELANEFLENLTDHVEGTSFVSEGQALIRTVSLLRGWQNQPQPDGRTIFEVILAERSELLAGRERALKESAAN